MHIKVCRADLIFVKCKTSTTQPLISTSTMVSKEDKDISPLNDSKNKNNDDKQGKNREINGSVLGSASPDKSKEIISTMKGLLNSEGIQNASSKRNRPAPNALEVDDNPHGLKRVVLEYQKKEQRKKSILFSNPMGATSCDASRQVITKIKDLYKRVIMPIEHKYGLYDFCLQTDGPIEDSEFDAKPMVLMLGQYRYDFCLLLNKSNNYFVELSFDFH